MSISINRDENLLISGFYTNNIDSFLKNIRSNCDTSTLSIQYFLFDKGIYKRLKDELRQDVVINNSREIEVRGLLNYNIQTYPNAVIYNNKTGGTIICPGLSSNGPLVIFSDKSNTIQWKPKVLIKLININNFLA